MNENYQLVVMVKSEIKDEARDKFGEKLEKVIKALGGKVVKTLEMGKKQLAYKINNLSEAIYLNMVIELPKAAVVQLEKKLVVDKEIIRHLLIKAEK